jgi:PAS domain S-box-containing protein
MPDPAPKDLNADVVRSQLAAIVDSSDDAIVSKSLTGQILSWNAGAERIFGYTRDEAVGQHITLIIPPELRDEETTILARLRRGERLDHFETTRVSKDGKRHRISLTVSPVRDASGTIVGASKIARDITERIELLEAERAARAEAERASRMKDEFLATISHELRTPLNAILGWAQMLRSGAAADSLERGLETIERNARAQAQIIEDLLDMSRIMSGKVRLDVQRVDLEKIVAASIESIRPTATVKQITIQSVLDPHAGPVSGDPNRLQQIFWNLLSNSIKFTPKGGKVQVLLERVNSHIEVSIIDTGEGIDPDFLPLVFDRFRQQDSSTARQHSGLGLGLSIVKQLVEMHGGTVRAKSPGKDKGATFILDFPLIAVHEPAEDGRRHPSDASRGASVSYDVTLRGVNILVVDDEPDSRGLVKTLLESRHASVAVAANASEAMVYLQHNQPDLIVSDIGMPEIDGIDFIRWVRTQAPSQVRNVPAIALTAYARTEDRTRAIHSGFNMHLAKPVEPTELIVMVSSLARRAT